MTTMTKGNAGGNDIQRTIDLLGVDGQTFELRILKAQGRNGRTDSGYFNLPDRLVKAAQTADGKAPAIYVTINPVDPACKARADNRLKEYADTTTADKDIVKRRILLIDCDPDRPSGISSTEAEHTAALECAVTIRSWLTEVQGWPEPLYADSGNGAHLDYAINLPNDADSTDLIKRVLAGLADRFNTDAVKVDRNVYNAARIVKLYGTLACKGDNTADRPHRRSCIISAPEYLPVVTRDQLVAIAAPEPTPAQSVRTVHPSENGHKDAAAAVKAASTAEVMAAYAAQHFGGAIKDEGREIRITGNSGLHINKEQGIWAVGGQPGKGGDAIDLYGTGVFGDSWNNRDPEQFKAALAEGAAFVNIPLPTYANSKKHAGRPRKEQPATPINGFHLTDAGNAERLIARHGQDLRYCHKWGKWLIWDGKRWQIDQDGEITRRAKATARSIYQEAAEATELDERTALAKHAMRSENAARLKAMIELAHDEPGVPVAPDQLDSDGWLLNCPNGTLDLRTGQLREHRRDDLITKLIPVAYHADATAPIWEKTLHRLMDGNQGLIDFLRRAVGYSLTGDTSEQVLFLMHGLGSNGKSTFLDTLAALMGDLAQTADMNSFLARENEGVRNDLAKLVGARLVSSVEVKEGKRLDETLVKQLTGGDRITTRFLFQDFFEFTPRFKLWIAANHKPVIRGTDFAIWRRIRLIPFAVTITETEKDKRLPAKLKAELPGILAWAVQGCLEWQANGLQEPPEVIAATQNYREESDILGGFLAEKTLINANFHAKAGDLYRAYTAWCEENGETPINQRRFGTAMTERGFARSRAAGGLIQYTGIGLVTTANSEPSERSEQKSGNLQLNVIHEGRFPEKGSLGSLNVDEPQQAATNGSEGLFTPALAQPHTPCPICNVAQTWQPDGSHRCENPTCSIGAKHAGQVGS